MINKYLPVNLKTSYLYGVLLICIFSGFLSSCKVYRPTYYFKEIKRDTVITGFLHNDLEMKIQKNDVLSIAVSSLNLGEDILYNRSASASEGISGFEVSLDGYIYMHKLGKTTVEGLTRRQLKNKLETELSPYLKDPIVTVNFSNHKLIVFGEKSSQVVEMPEEKITLLEVMAKSGAVTPDSKLNNVMVIREKDNTKEFKHINLEDPSIFSSPWYYLQPNDIVVVKPNEEKIDSELKRTRLQLLYTTLLSGLTLVFLVIDRILR